MTSGVTIRYPISDRMGGIGHSRIADTDYRSRY